MSEAQGFQWQDGALHPQVTPPRREVLVSDSWLLDSGRVLALDVHEARFVASVQAHDAARGEEAALFFAAAVDAVPDEGAWFPRVELVEGAHSPEFRLLLREAPSRAESARLVTADHDPRTRPLVKGPDLDRLEALRAAAHAAGADEAVIVTPEGLVVEGNYSSLLWWRGDTLCVVADDLPRLPGVTERALVTLATALGVEVVPDLVAPEELDGLEVWIANSLHGLRIATTWVDGPSLAEEPGRLRLWRSRLATLARPAS
jgi:branched-subunit amino acid aminotransferase/4-amino-4-deoxychorismate lyase